MKKKIYKTEASLSLDTNQAKVIMQMEWLIIIR